MCKRLCVKTVWIAFVFILAFAMAACSDDGASSGGDTDTEGTSGDACDFGEVECVSATSFRQCDTFGEWGDEEACSAGEVCESGICIEETVSECIAGDTRCIDQERFQVCSENGRWGAMDICPEGELCLFGACQTPGGNDGDEDDIEETDDAPACEQGEKSCDEDGKERTCTSEGTWGAAVACGDREVCRDGEGCVDMASGDCEPGDIECTSRFYYHECKGDGSGWEEEEIPCPGGYVCEDGEGCVDNRRVCVPGTTGCLDEQTIQICNDDGTGWLEETVPCPPGTTGNRCLYGNCLSLCDIAEQENSYIGCEYWPVVLPNPQLEPAYKQTDRSEFAVVVSNNHSEYNASVSVEFPAGSGTIIRNVTVGHGSHQTIRLPYHEIEGQYRGYRAFRLTSSIPVTVYQFNPITARLDQTCMEDFNNPCYSHTNDASLLLPTHVLGKEYMGLAYPTMLASRDDGVNYTNNAAFLTIVATEDNTYLTVGSRVYTQSSDTFDSLSPTAPFQDTLNKGEVIQIMTIVDHNNPTPGTCLNETAGFYTMTYCLGTDISGSTILADKPVAVYSGNECVFVPHYRWACDHLEQQLFPAEAWTTLYIAARLHAPVDTHPNLYKIVALEPDTYIETNPPEILSQESPYSGMSCASGMLQKGQSCIIETSEDFVIQANDNHPILVAQYLVGQDYDGQGSGTSDVGDPAFVLIPPVKQFKNDYIFLVPDTYAENWITLLTAQPDIQINLDGEPLALEFRQIADANAYRAEYQISSGTHRIDSESQFGIMVYGYDQYVSYAYPGGLDFSMAR